MSCTATVGSLRSNGKSERGHAGPSLSPQTRFLDLSKIRLASRQTPRGKVAKVQGVTLSLRESVLATRKPRLPSGSRCCPRSGRRSGGTPAGRPRSPRAAPGGCNRRWSRRCRRRRPCVTLVPAVLDPLPHVAVHVVQAPGVRRVGADLGGPAHVHAEIGLLGRRRIVTPPVAGRRPGPAGVLPLRLRRAGDRACRSPGSATPRRPGRPPRTRRSPAADRSGRTP